MALINKIVALGIVIVIMAIVFFAGIKQKKTMAFIFISLCIMLIGYMNVYTKTVSNNYARAIEEYQEKNEETDIWAEVEGKVLQREETDSGYVLTIRAEKIGTLPGEFKGSMKMLLYIKKGKVLLGQYIKVTGKLQRLESPTNPGQFDGEKYYGNKGITLVLKSGKIIERGSRYSIIKEKLYSLRMHLNKNYDKVLSEKDASVLKVMLLGEKKGLDTATKRMYQINGIAHILAISGLHIAIIGMSFFKFFRKKIGSYLWSGVITIGLILLYGLLTGMGISTQRALIMMIISVVGKILGRQGDMLTSMGIASIIMVLINPLIIMDCGFLMSFGAIIGTSVVYPLLLKIFGKGGKISQAILASLSINLITTPLTLYYYYQFPLYGIIINIFVIPCVAVLVGSGLVAGLVAFVSLKAAVIPSSLVIVILRTYEILCNLWEKLPGGCLNLGHINKWVVFVFYLGLGISLFLGNYIVQHFKKIKLIFAAIPLAISIILLCVSLDKDFKVVYLDVGQGDGMLIHFNNGINIMIDGGSTSQQDVGEYIILPAIRYYGMNNIDYAFVSHGDKDHISGLLWLLNTENTGVKIKNLVLPQYGIREDFMELILAAKKTGTKVIYVKKGDSFITEAGRIDVIYPNGAQKENVIEDANTLSMVLKLNWKNQDFIFTGDISQESEQEIMKSKIKLNSTVLKCAHHGSNYSNSSEFLKEVAPKYSVISCGIKNMYGHPGEETLKRLKKQNSSVFRTDQGGAIIYTKGNISYYNLR